MIYELDGIAPDIAEDAWVAPDANLIGKVVLEAGRECLVRRNLAR